VLLTRRASFAALALVASFGPLACGSSAPDAPPTPDASTDAAAPLPDAAVGVDATVDSAPPSDARADVVDVADASDAAPDAAAVVVGCTAGSQTVTMVSGNVTVAYDLTAGVATFSYGALPKVTGFYAGVQLTTYITSRDYPAHACATTLAGTTVTSTGGGLPPMTQTFTFDGENHFLTQVSVSGTSLSATWMAPVVTSTSGSVDVGRYGDVRVLWVPFDNDMFVSYNAAPLSSNTGTSFEVAAFFDNTSRNGIVVGSVTHDTWKTGIYYVGGTNTLDAMNVFGGANDATYTHDVVPHGAVTGDTVTSPLVFVGAGPDWRDLLEEFADANAAQVPKMAWDGGVPFGWNSWGILKTTVSYAAAVAVSDALHTTLEPAGFENDGTVYVNLDSYWDNLSTAQLTAFVAHCHANGQKAGIYWAPFVDWGLEDTRQVEGTTTATYGQIWLRDTQGNPISVDGAYAVDPTNAATKSRIDYFFGEFATEGFDYVKLDFLSHGALESTVRADPNVTTGIAAYNEGMQYVQSKINGSMFVSESIAPLFPYQYGQARRVSCDVGGAAVGGSSAEYELNSAAYGWWMSGRLYAFNDPDEMTFQGYTATDNMARLISGVVSGTVFLDGDDLSSDAGVGVAMANLSNARINAVAKLGKAFRPVEGNTGAGPPAALVLADGGLFYLAVFNFTSAAVTQAVDLGRAGLDAATTYTVTDLWSGATSSATGTLSVSLDVDGAKLLKLQ
jgi:Alpha galactosidase C-terminal beta sandwich domain